MRSVQPGQFRQLILRERLCLANLFDPVRNKKLNVLQSIQAMKYAALKHPAYKQHEDKRETRWNWLGFSFGLARCGDAGRPPRHLFARHG
jgi:hypothetical protein